MYTYGKYIYGRRLSLPTTDPSINRANRAQFSEVSMRTFVEEDMIDVALPTVQGLDDDDSECTRSIS